MHDQVRTKQEFDVLLNKEKGAKLAWTDWDKFKGLQFSGSISTINGASVSFYIYLLSTLKKITSMVFILVIVILSFRMTVIMLLVISSIILMKLMTWTMLLVDLILVLVLEELLLVLEVQKR